MGQAAAARNLPLVIDFTASMALVVRAGGATLAR